MNNQPNDPNRNTEPRKAGPLCRVFKKIDDLGDDDVELYISYRKKDGYWKLNASIGDNEDYMILVRKPGGLRNVLGRMVDFLYGRIEGEVNPRPNTGDSDGCDKAWW